MKAVTTGVERFISESERNEPSDPEKHFMMLLIRKSWASAKILLGCKKLVIRKKTCCFRLTEMRQCKMLLKRMSLLFKYWSEGPVNGYRHNLYPIHTIPWEVSV